MEVIIDGIKYVPQDHNKVTIGGIEYDNVAHWLTNITRRTAAKVG